MSSSRVEHTQNKILDAANRLLLDRGFHGVGMESVAVAAGVSRQTVYDRFQNKGGLLRAMVARSEEAAELPLRLQQVVAQTDARRTLMVFLDTLAAVEPLVYPFSRLVYAARIEDPTAAELWEWRIMARYMGLSMVVSRLAAEGRLREGVTTEEATDIAWALTSPHQYEYLVIGRGWSIEQYRAHLERTVTALLLRPRRGAKKRAGDESSL